MRARPKSQIYSIVRNRETLSKDESDLEIAVLIDKNVAGFLRRDLSCTGP